MTQMTHQQAVEERAVERYLLDELAGEPRDRFEDHLFDCTLCAADLKASMLFLETARQELCAQAPAPGPVRAVRTWWNALLQPLILGPALAASLCVVAYQSFILVPTVETQLAAARTPSVVDTLVLANAGPRGEGIPNEIVAPAHGAYLLAVDLPPAEGAAAYRCTLLNPSGKPVWHSEIAAAQNLDSVKIQVPAAATGPGALTLEVQALGAKQEILSTVARYSFQLRLQQ